MDVIVVKDFGNGFVRISEKQELKCSNPEILNHHRAVQFPCGSILINETDAKLGIRIKNEDANKHNIRITGGPGKWIFLQVCKEVSEAAKDDAILFVMNYVMNEQAKFEQHVA
jgi:hypothetical protein